MDFPVSMTVGQHKNLMFNECKQVLMQWENKTPNRKIKTFKANLKWLQ